MLNYDMFGGISEPPISEKQGRKFKTMQEMYGTIDGHKCKECRHCIKRRYAGTYYKCELWRMSNSAASDIRLKNKACGKFETREGILNER